MEEEQAHNLNEKHKQTDSLESEIRGEERKQFDWISSFEFYWVSVRRAEPALPRSLGCPGRSWLVPIGPGGCRSSWSFLEFLDGGRHGDPGWSGCLWRVLEFLECPRCSLRSF